MSTYPLRRYREVMKLLKECTRARTRAANMYEKLKMGTMFVTLTVGCLMHAPATYAATKAVVINMNKYCKSLRLQYA